MKTIKKYQKALNEMIEEIRENRKYPLLVFYITQEDYEKNKPFYILFNPEYGKSVRWISLSIESYMYTEPDEPYDFLYIDQRLILFTNQYKYLMIDGGDSWDVDNNGIWKNGISCDTLKNSISRIIDSSEDTYNHYIKIHRFERPEEYVLDENEEICILTKDIHDKFLSFSLISAESQPSRIYAGNYIFGYPCTKYVREYNLNFND